MRYTRQNCILELVNKYEIETQEMLLFLLKDRGFDVTQATVSRDIKELHLFKMQSASGKYIYTYSDNGDQPIMDRFGNVFKASVISIKSAENLIVVKTLSGCGSAAAEAIDSSKFSEVVGTIAGDNTFLVIVDTTEHADKLVKKFNSMLED